MSQPPLLNYHRLSIGDTIGAFTPSSPSYSDNPGLFENGIANLQKLGFRVVEGNVTKQRRSEGYRSASPQARAAEFMELVADPNVNALISTIGGSNSSSLIPYLNFDLIRKQQKMVCGFSDVTSLHLAIQKYAGLRTVYGPSVMCWFGEWPDGIAESTAWFMDAVANHQSGERAVTCPLRWSNHARNWANGEWKSVPREWQPQNGWKVLNEGSVEAPIVAVNFNTLMTAAGTPYWPDLHGKILLLEDMEASLSRTERHLRQLQLMGVFDQIAGLLIGIPEFYRQEGAPFGYHDLFNEVLGPRPYPIVGHFNCSHTVPMISIPQLSQVRLAAHGSTAIFAFLKSAFVGV